MSRGHPEILVVVRASPMHERTEALLESIALQKPDGIARVVVFSHRRPSTIPEFGREGIEQLSAEPDWMTQVRALAAASACRWVVLPSSGDRYLPGAFETIAELGTAGVETVVGGCQILRAGRPVRIGPEPFRFDYFALLSGFNYIAPGATFIDIRRYLAEGGFDPRFPSAPTYEFLLRTGAAHGVDCCSSPLLETEADPFPGIPSDWAPLYASEALAVTLNYNRSFVAPGAVLGLMAVLADRVEPYARSGFYDDQVVSRLTASGPLLKARYLEQSGGAGSSKGQLEAPRPVRALRAQIKMLTPSPIWDALRRTKRAWKAFRSPLY